MTRSDYMTNTFSSSTLPDQTSRTILITGTARGIGHATAKVLVGAGAHVVLAVRDLERGKAAAAEVPGHAEARELDLADLASVRAFAASWTASIDVLINNAGVSAPELRRTTDEFEL